MGALSETYDAARVQRAAVWKPIEQRDSLIPMTADEPQAGEHMSPPVCRTAEDPGGEASDGPTDAQSSNQHQSDTPAPRERPTETPPAIWPAVERPDGYETADRSDDEILDLYLPAEEKSKNQPEEDE